MHALLHRAVRLAVAGALILPGLALAQEAAEDPRATATAVRTDQAPTIDGRLDEPFWHRIAPVTEFLQREPEEGIPASERTEVRIAYDDHFLYFGMLMHDREPGGIRRNILQREGATPQDDRIMIGLDTFGDRRNGYVFEATPFGTQGDAIITDEASTNWNWEGVFWSEARVTADGWVLELAIPFSTLRYPDDRDPVMGLAIFRSIRRKNEEAFWPLIGRDYRNHISQVSRYGRLTGLSGLARSRNVQVKPYVLLGRQTPGAGGMGAETPRDVGADVRYALSSSTTLDLTVNTDFAQVEADSAQINLTRFSLFFPEKREFFLERNDLFAFGVPRHPGGFGGPPLEAATYFSRRMGLSQPIRAGARVSGKAGAVTYGLLNLQTGDEGALDGANYGVARARVDLSPRRSIGAIVTNLQGNGTYNRATGADMAFRFFRSSGFNGWVSRVWTPDNQPSAAAGNANLLLRNDRFSIETDYLNVGRHFNPGIGFVRRTDMIRYKGEAGWYPRPALRGVRQLQLVGGAYYIEGQDHERQSTQARAEATIQFDSDDSITVEHTRDMDLTRDPFALTGHTVAPGEYRFPFTSVSLNSNWSRRIYGNLNAGWGELYSAGRRQIGGGATVKISPYVRLGGSVERNVLDFRGADRPIATTLVGLNAFLATGRTLYSNWLVQYDSVSRDLQANIRVRLLYRPGSDFYFVFNTAHRFDDRFNPRPASFDRRTVVTKLTYMLSL